MSSCDLIFEYYACVFGILWIHGLCLIINPIALLSTWAPKNGMTFVVWVKCNSILFSAYMNVFIGSLFNSSVEWTPVMAINFDEKMKCPGINNDDWMFSIICRFVPAW